MQIEANFKLWNNKRTIWISVSDFTEKKVGLRVRKKDGRQLCTNGRLEWLSEQKIRHKNTRDVGAGESHRGVDWQGCQKLCWPFPKETILWWIGRRNATHSLLSSLGSECLVLCIQRCFVQVRITVISVYHSDWEEIFGNGPFSAFFNDFEIFNGPFLIILHRLWWAIFQVNGTMAHGPLPSQSLLP